MECVPWPGALRGRCRPSVPAPLAYRPGPARQEPLGRVLLEAAASGCPVVATDVGGTREIFPGPEDGGMLVASESPGQLANAICQLLAAPQVCHSLGQAGRRRAGDCFGVRKSADRLVQHYREVSKDSPQKGS